MRDIATGESHGVAARELEKSADEFVDPMLWQIGRESEREEYSARDSCHGGDIAESASEAAVSDGVGRMPFAVEVNALEGEICCNKHFVSTRNVEDGAVVANPAAEFAAGWGGGAADSLDEFPFGQRHNSSFRFRVSSFKSVA